jgi:TPP-dependent pyruvate/acetoin dehydrogenase alpha subunit
MVSIKIPASWYCIHAMRENKPMTALEKFIYRWQRGTDDASQEWRDELKAAIEEEIDAR